MKMMTYLIIVCIYFSLGFSQDIKEGIPDGEVEERLESLSEIINSGLVVINGVFLEKPYKVKWDGTIYSPITVNGAIYIAAYKSYTNKPPRLIELSYDEQLKYDLSVEITDFFRQNAIESGIDKAGYMAEDKYCDNPLIKEIQFNSCRMTLLYSDGTKREEYIGFAPLKDGKILKPSNEENIKGALSYRKREFKNLVQILKRDEVVFAYLSHKVYLPSGMSRQLIKRYIEFKSNNISKESFIEVVNNHVSGAELEKVLENIDKIRGGISEIYNKINYNNYDIAFIDALDNISSICNQ